MKYIKKPIAIDAIQYRRDNWDDVCVFIGGVGYVINGRPQRCFIDGAGKATYKETNVIGLLLPTLEGIMLVRENDWIIRGVKGELYPCKQDIFELTYEKVK